MNLKLLLLPQRYVFAILGFFATFVAYMMRISLDLTLPHMANIGNITSKELYDPSSCSDFNIIYNQSDVTAIDDINQHKFDWDADAIHNMKEGFGKVYIMAIFPGGIIADRRGGKTILGIAILILSTATFIIPITAKFFGANSVYYMRILSGIVSGPIIPVLYSIMSKWVPVTERALVASIILPGALIGFVTGSKLGELIIINLGWPAVHYSFGLMGLLWCILWKVLFYSTPDQHPRISRNEKRYLNENLLPLIRMHKHDLDPVPLKAILRYGALWATIISYVGKELVFATFVVQVPQFMKNVLRYDITFSDYFTYTPYFCMWMSALLLGFTSDIIVKRDLMCMKNSRRIFTGIGAAGSGVCIIMIMYSGCSPALAVFWRISGMIFLGAFYSGSLISCLDFAPNYSGTMIGLTETLSVNLVTLLPIINKLIVTEGLLHQWQLLFWIVTVFLTISVVIYLYYVQTDQAWWDDVRKKGYPETWSHGLLECVGYIDENGESIYLAKETDLEKDTTKTTAL